MGTLWNRSGTIERYSDDIRASGAKAYFFEGGTTTELTVYEDSAQAAAFETPVVADANGRWPDVFVPFITSYDVRVVSAFGDQLTFSQEIPNADPAGIPPPVVTAQQLVQTGMIHAELINTSKAGYVRLNGRSIGNPTSGADERPDDDTLPLYTYLWNNLLDTIAPVAGGRGSTAASDFAANKTLTLPNCQGAMFVGLDNMGATAAGAFTGLTFASGDALTPGSLTGDNARVLSVANLPVHSHTGTTGASVAHTHTGSTDTNNVGHTHQQTGGGTTSIESGSHTHDVSGTTSTESATHGHLYNESNSNNQGGIASGGGLTANSGVFSNTTGANNATHTHTFSDTSDGPSDTHTHTFTLSGNTGGESTSHTHTFTTNADGVHTHVFTTDDTGSGTAFNNLPFARLVTWYIKL